MRTDTDNHDAERKRPITLVLLREARSEKVPHTGGATVMDLIRGSGLPVDGTLAFYDDRPVPLDHMPEPGSRLTLVTVASGG